MIFEKFSKSILSYGRRERKLLLILTDSSLILISIITSYWLLDFSYIDFNKIVSFFFLNLFTSLPIYYFTGQYKGITRFWEFTSIQIHIKKYNHYLFINNNN